MLKMKEKKSLITLTMEQRLKVLEDCKQLPVSAVALKYNVNRSTIYRIQQNASRVMEFSEKSKKQRQRQRIKKPVYDKLEQGLLEWFREKKAVNDFVSDALLMEKAVELRDVAGLCSKFKVSEGWLANFKRRYDIVLKAHKERTSADINAAKTFVSEFEKFVSENDINENNIYNMHEAQLLWRSVSSKLLTETIDNALINGVKKNKERLTVVLCANSTGTHKLKPTVVYKFSNPRALKNYKNKLPVGFKSQKNAYFTQTLFLEWFENDFKPSVRENQLRNSIVGKTLLLVDSCGAHKVPMDMIDHDNFIIMYLPLNTASLIQPMDQSVIPKFKAIYRHKVFKKATSCMAMIDTFYKYYTIRDCIYLIVNSWTEITPEIIRHSWSKVMPTRADVSTFIDEAFTESKVDIFLPTHEAIKSEEPVIEDNGNKSGDDKENEPEDKSEYDNEDQNNDGKEPEIEGPDDERRNDIKYLLHRLNDHASREPLFVQHMVEALKTYFLATNR